MIRYALILGITFLLLGILGFVPPLTPNDTLFGIFAVNTAHNLVHLLFGIIGIWAGLSEDPAKARGFTWSVLLVYGLVALLGIALTPDEGMLLGLVHVNMADHVLHLALTLSALGMIMADRRSHQYPV